MSSVFTLPNEAANHEFQVPLDGALFRLVFLFNTRDSFWYMDIFNGLTGDLLRGSIKLVSSWDLLRLYQASEKPEGNLLMQPQGADGSEANTLEALGTDVLLTYTGES